MFARRVALKKKLDIRPLQTEDLLLDNENPRFAGAQKGISQKEIAKNLWEDMHLEELISSIAVNGYYQQEPLLVVKKTGTNNYIVIEGNRRLASVKILIDPKLAKHVGARLSELPKINKKATKELQSLPAIIYPSRKDLWAYLSYRHINGPRSWSSISKAEYIASLHENLSLTFDVILSSTGDKLKTSIKLFNGLMVLRQGEKITRFKRDDFKASKFNFSHLYTILAYPNTRKYLGIEDLDLSRPFNENPVPADKKKELEALLVWLFGSKSMKLESIIKSQNPDLKTLDDVLDNPVALANLQETRNLYEAHEYTEQEDKRLEKLIIRLEQQIRKVKSIEDFYKGDNSLFERMESIAKIANELLSNMSKKVGK